MGTRARHTRARRIRPLIAGVAAAGLAGAVLAPASAGGQDTATGVGQAPSSTGMDETGTPETGRAETGTDARSISTQQVTLVTGDVVTWETFADGRGSATVDESAQDAPFQTIESGDDFYVIPEDVAPLVGTTLDRELFNVPALVDAGYVGDAGTPVIVLGDGSGMGTATQHGVRVKQELTSINGYAGVVTADAADGFGEYLAQAAVSTSPTLAGVDQILLDRPVEVNLEESVPQTGAPEAWAAGYDGTGITVAVLDTGIDETHPDIGDKVLAAENFTETETTADGHGHGTHVAATVAGTGDASDGLRKGVAPGADLLVGKVLDDRGNGQQSWIIAGMEWAAAEGADVISMSLGGGATDGTDPMAEAVNTLTEEQDVLFVIAAGNSGSGEQTVESPGTADAALTVGAVDKDSELASFSSRGPRVGDYAIKPDITAPGVGIVAARASDTSMGTPVDDLYTSANGTSMATPHVAGAVAILSQQHPDWDAADLKGALVGAAAPAPDLTVYEQGGGELDIATAIDTDIVATPGTVNLGYFQYPHEGEDPVTQTLTYTNHGEGTQTLDLAVNLVDAEGNPSVDGMVTVEPSTVTLEAGASVEVAVSVDASLGAEALYSGHVVATQGGDPVVQTPTGLFKEGEMFTVNVEGVQQDGRPAARDSVVDVIDAHDTTAFREINVDYVDGVASVRVPPGTYSVMSVVTTLDAEDRFYLDKTMMGDPELEVTDDVTMVLDARESTQITVDTGDVAELESRQMAYHRVSSEKGSLTHSWSGGDDNLSAIPTEPPSLGDFEFYTAHELVDTTSTPHRWYDLVFPHEGSIPTELDHTVDHDELATLTTTYHSDVSDHTYGWTRAKWRPYEDTTLTYVRRVSVPTTQLELISPGDTRWQQEVTVDAPFTGEIGESTTTYAAGEEREISWFGAPRTPSLIEGNSDTPGELPTREGDTLALEILEWGDSQIGESRHAGDRDSEFDTTAFALYQDGELVTEDSRAKGDFEVAAGDSRLRLELDVAREAPWWTTSTSTSTAWELNSQTTTEATALPLLLVDLDIDVDVQNAAPHPRDVSGPTMIGLHVRHPRGVDGAPIEGARAWTSHDDGATWIARPIRSTGDGQFEFPVDRRDGDHTSIRIEAWDADDATVEQEIIRAYTTKER